MIEEIWEGEEEVVEKYRIGCFEEDVTVLGTLLVPG
jgi:hypothetical protein